MPLVGLTGMIGAGKSTVAAMFAAHGARIVDADRIAHAVLDEPAVRSAIADRFGAAVVADDGTVRRGVLAERVFGPDPTHAAALQALEAIVHPRVGARIEAAVEDAFGVGGDNDPVVVLDVPLLAQSGVARRCHWVVIVECAEAIRRGRLEARGLSPSQQAAREAAWHRRHDRGAASWPPDRIRTVDSSGSLSYTRSQVDRIWSEITASAGPPDTVHHGSGGPV